MLSIVMNARNAPMQVNGCLAGLLESVARLRMQEKVEYIFADDASDCGDEIISQFVAARKHAKAPVKIFRFKKRQHYSAGLAYTFSAASGESILYVSHDMVITPDFIRTLLAVAAMDPSIGVVRGTSPHVDGPHEYRIPIAPPPRDVADIFSFSAYVAERNGLTWVEDRFLTGDSMLIKSNALEKVGIFDRRYFSYFGDVDFGLRVQRAGLKLVCAMGAWLLHEGAAHYKRELPEKDSATIYQERMRVVGEAYGVFRRKWDQTMPDKFTSTNDIDFAGLRSGPPPDGGEYQPKLGLNNADVEQL